MKTHASLAAVCLAAVCLTALTAGCGRREAVTPVQPTIRGSATAATLPHSAPSDPSGERVDSARPAAAPTTFAAEASEHLIQNVAFPPRNEPLDFRRTLEVVYRDDLRRQPTSSFVDLEGTIVWTQEYLRYRVNQCGHLEAVVRVMRQIDGFGIQPVCSDTESVVFPPRQEPFDFRQQLEAKYRDGLRRSPSQTFVDIEGDIVWTQEYLRYRVSGCPHFDAQSRVFLQIAGRGVQPDCTGGPSADPSVLTDTIEPSRARGYGPIDVPADGLFTFTLTWGDSTVDLDLIVTDGLCDRFPLDGCRIIARSEQVRTNAEQVSFMARRGEALLAWVLNYDLTRSQTFQLRLGYSPSLTPTHGRIAPRLGGARAQVEVGVTRAKR